MNTWILLLRGINIGGRNVLRMQALRETLTRIGLADVRTYIQSGNAVFRSRHRSAGAVRDAVVKAIDDAHGLQPEALVLTPGGLRRAIDANPYVDEIADHRRMFVYFLFAKPDAPDLDELAQQRRHGEKFALAGDLFFLYAPEGMARSKLGGSVEKKLGVTATARNWRTVNRLAAMTAQNNV